METANSSAAAPFLSVIIPVRNEAEDIVTCLSSLLNEQGNFEVVVVDGESDDGSIREASNFSGIKIISSPPGRGRQMNAGVRVAYGNTLLFLRADTRLTPGWYDEVLRFESSPEYSCGTFPLTFESGQWRFKILSWWIRCRTRLFSFPGGDQGLLVRRTQFTELSGFRDLPILEDLDLCKRLKKRGRLFVGSIPAMTSTRKWSRSGVIRKSMRNLSLYLLYKAGISINRLASLYRSPELIISLFCKNTGPAGSSPVRSENEADPFISIIQHELLVYTSCEAKKTGHAICLYHPKEQYSFMYHIRLGTHIRSRAQASGDLGRRMECAFRDMVGNGSPAIMITANCPRLNAELLAKAEKSMDHHDAVIGKTRGGGVYVIGVNRLVAGLFDHITWNAVTTFDELMKRLHSFNYSLYLLPELHPLDTVGDLELAMNDPEINPELRKQLLLHWMNLPSAEHAENPADWR